MTRASGHEGCSTSTGICGCLTFGRGFLDRNGYWEIPCYECAREWEKNHPEMGPCWPQFPMDVTPCVKCGRKPGEHTALCRSEDYEDLIDSEGIPCGCEECHAFF